LKIEVTPVAEPSAPCCQIIIADKISFDGILKSKVVITEELKIDQTIKLQIKLFQKEYKENQETAIIINTLEIDSISMIPNYIGQVEYDNDHNYSDPTTYLGFNGTWTLDITPNFYMWLHRVDGKGWLLDKYSIKE
jgi:hypothetical protein